MRIYKSTLLIALVAACVLSEALSLPMSLAQTQAARAVEFADPGFEDAAAATNSSADVGTKVMTFSIPEGKGNSPSNLTVITSTAPKTDALVQAALLGAQAPAGSGIQSQTFVSGDNHTLAVAADISQLHPEVTPPIFVTFENMNQPGRLSRLAVSAAHEVRADKITFLFFAYRMQNNYFSWIHTAQSNNLSQGSMDVLIAFTSLMLFLRYNQVSSTRLVDTVAAKVRAVGRKLRILRTPQTPESAQGQAPAEVVNYPSATAIQRDGARVFASIGISLFQQFLTKGLSSTASIWNFEMVRDICILILFSNFANYGYTRAFEKWNSMWPRGSTAERERPMSHNAVNRFNQVKISIQSHISPEASFLDPHEHWILSSYKIARIGIGVLGLAFWKWGEPLISWMKEHSAYRLTQKAREALNVKIEKGFASVSERYETAKQGLREIRDRIPMPSRESHFCPILLETSTPEGLPE